MYEIDNIKELALFRFDDRSFGIDISHIQEINKNMSFTKVYNAPDYIQGVLNLRGQIVTVIDLRTKFNRPASADLFGRRVIIVKYKGESVGLLVDSIDDIIDFDPKCMEHGTAQMAGVSANYFVGVYKREKDLVIILDIEEILNDDELKTAVA